MQFVVSRYTQYLGFCVFLTPADDSIIHLKGGKKSQKNARTQTCLECH